MAILDDQPFHPILLRINFSDISFYDFAYGLFTVGQTVFEPIKNLIPPEIFNDLFRHMEISQFQVSMINNDFIEFARLQVLTLNGYQPDGNGYYKKNGVIPDIEEELMRNWT